MPFENDHVPIVSTQHAGAGSEQAMARCAIWILICAVLTTSNASAQVRTEEDCAHEHPQIQSPIEMARCTSDSLMASHSLQSAYLQLKSRVPSEYQPYLSKAQQAWEKHRDAQCAFDAGGNPGSTGWDSSIISCVADADRERARTMLDDLASRWKP